MLGVRPSSATTPNTENSEDKSRTPASVSQIPTTQANPSALPLLAASHAPTPRSPLTLANQNSNSLGHNADNSNMSFSQDHEDDTSMTSDEPSCSSPAHHANNSSHTASGRAG